MSLNNTQIDKISTSRRVNVILVLIDKESKLLDSVCNRVISTAFGRRVRMTLSTGVILATYTGLPFRVILTHFLFSAWIQII